MMSTSSVSSYRSLHLVDLENLVGDPFAPAPLVHDTLARYLTVAALAAGRPGDRRVEPGR